MAAKCPKQLRAEIEFKQRTIGLLGQKRYLSAYGVSGSLWKKESTRLEGAEGWGMKGSSRSWMDLRQCRTKRADLECQMIEKGIFDLFEPI